MCPHLLTERSETIGNDLCDNGQKEKENQDAGRIWNEGFKNTERMIYITCTQNSHPRKYRNGLFSCRKHLKRFFGAETKLVSWRELCG